MNKVWIFAQKKKKANTSNRDSWNGVWSTTTSVRHRYSFSFMVSHWGIWSAYSIISVLFYFTLLFVPCTLHLWQFWRAGIIHHIHRGRVGVGEVTEYGGLASLQRKASKLNLGEGR